MKTSERKISKAHISVLRKREQLLRARAMSDQYGQEARRRWMAEANAIAWAVSLLREHAKSREAT